ncbi:MAG: hypothetical protein IPK83_23885 [Planctomycetes bacterium]|nr:hypothetical protein [Planctomycetota bacterium]
MRSWFRDLDELLRGRRTLPEDLAAGRIHLSLGRFGIWAILLGGCYGMFMGLFAVTGRDPAAYEQLMASTVKLPGLFLITLLVTFPSLYVFNALLGSRLRFLETLKLLIGAVVVNVTVAASLGPILGFFTLSTTSYAFMIVLNVALLAISGAVGLGFLLHALKRMSAAAAMQRMPVTQVVSSDDAEGTVEGSGHRELAQAGPSMSESKSIFRIWVIIYGLVGAQTGWLLRPFIGSPDLPFSWFRPREGNFFQSVWTHFQALLAP